jgi:hypothetical protein
LISINRFGVVQTQHFGAYLLMKKGSSKFTFSTSSSMKDIGVDVASDEWLQNFTTRADQAMMAKSLSVDQGCYSGRLEVIGQA